MLSNKKIVCPNNLIKVAKKTGTVEAAIANAGEIFPMESVHKAVQHNLIKPTFIGSASGAAPVGSIIISPFGDISILLNAGRTIG